MAHLVDGKDPRRREVRALGGSLHAVLDFISFGLSADMEAAKFVGCGIRCVEGKDTLGICRRNGRTNATIPESSSFGWRRQGVAVVLARPRTASR